MSQSPEKVKTVPLAYMCRSLALFARLACRAPSFPTPFATSRVRNPQLHGPAVKLKSTRVVTGFAHKCCMPPFVLMLLMSHNASLSTVWDLLLACFGSGLPCSKHCDSQRCSYSKLCCVSCVSLALVYCAAHVESCHFWIERQE